MVRAGCTSSLLIWRGTPEMPVTRAVLTFAMGRSAEAAVSCASQRSPHMEPVRTKAKSLSACSSALRAGVARLNCLARLCATKPGRKATDLLSIS
jgi:hypothetical protein